MMHFTPDHFTPNERTLDFIRHFARACQAKKQGQTMVMALPMN